ncbi:MAG: 4Fe-4S binding protein [Bacillota bacterium]
MTIRVITANALCAGCEKCFVFCPTGAVKEGAASDCIGCARCVKACPKGARRFQEDWREVRGAITSGRRAVVSFASAFLAWLYPQPPRIFSLLLSLGFIAAEETVNALAQLVSYRDMPLGQGRVEIDLSCPAVAGLVR